MELGNKDNGREVKSVIKKREEYRYSKTKKERVNFDSEDNVEYVENNVSILNTMCLKNGQEISDILEKERNSSGVFLQNAIESRANSVKVIKTTHVDFRNKYKAGNSLDEQLYPNGNFYDDKTSHGENEFVNEIIDNNNACKYVEDRFKEYKIVYECEDDVDNRAKRLAAFQRLYSADFERNWL